MFLYRLRQALFCIILSCSALWAQTGLSPELSGRVAGSVYEVVLEKPGDDPLIYAEPLPMDLIPFHLRNDEFHSIGTAFAVGENLFLSAAHVFALDSHTQRGNLSLRDTIGNTYAVDKILKYDNRRDFVLFTVRELKQERWLSLSNEAGINEYVNAVGNAHGEGIIFRDGLLTSMTYERENGEWRWLRFSAAASPGNSGGPLLDSEGNVIGIVTAKSDNENLNYALPVSEIGELEAAEALFQINWVYKIPNINYRYRLKKEYRAPLPVTYNELHETMKTWKEEIVDISIGAIKEEHGDEIFPSDPGSDELLTLTTATLFPCIINEKDDSTWILSQPGEIETSDLGAGGYLRTGKIWGDVFWQLELSDGEDSVSLFKDPDALMDTILSGYKVTRNIGSEEIRIESFGEFRETAVHQDRWGRYWLQAIWDLPFADYKALLYALPTPSGSVGILNFISSSESYAYDSDFREMTDFVYVSYFAEFSEWKSFLSQSELSPEVFQKSTFEYSIGEKLQLSTGRFDLVYDAGLMGIKHDSMLYAIPSFFRSAGDVVWDLSRVYIYEEVESDNFIALEKKFHPFHEHDAERMKSWDTVVENKYPYNRDSIISKGKTYIYETASLTGEDANHTDSPFLWTYYISREGEQKKSDMESALKKLRNGFSLSHSEIRAALLGTGIEFDDSALTRINSMTIFQAIALEDRDTLDKFLVSGKDLEARNEEGQTPLAAALGLAQEEMVLSLLDKGAQLNVRDKDGATPLLTALRNMPETMGRQLIERGADPTIRDNDGYSPLMVACQNEMAELATLIAGMGVSLDPVNFRGRSALYYACTNHLDDLAVWMIRKGAPVSLARDVGYTIFMTALKNSSEEVAELLMEKGSYRGGRSGSNWSPLMMALRYGKSDIALKLMEDVNDLEETNNDGWTVLHMAVRYGTLDTVKALIARGSDLKAIKPNNADILMLSLYNEENRDIADYIMKEYEPDYDIVDTENWSTLMIALRYGSKEQAEEVYRRTSVKGGVTDSGWTALMFAVRNGHEGLIKSLLEDGNPLNAVDEDGLTALHLAAGYASLETVKLLVEEGALIDAPDSKNYTPLMQAVRKGKQETAAYLAEKGAETDTVSHSGWTALMLAIRYCDPPLATVLLKKGASVNISKTGSDWSTLHLALRYGNREVAEMVMRGDVDVNGRTDRGMTPLHLAAEYNEDLVAALLTIGADPDLQNDSGDTAIHVAVEEGKDEAVRQLLRGGARSDIRNNEGKTARELASGTKSLDKLF